MDMPAPRSIKTTCPYCGVGCGVIADVRTGGDVSVRGDPDHPANFGRLCSKGSALAETVGLEDRLLSPRVHGAPTDWNKALDLVAGKFGQTIREHGPDSVAFYVSGQFLTEDYYVANKLMKGFIGSANIDSNSRLCMASSVAGHRRAFGSDTVPGCYEDLDLADLVVLVGSNLAWCHPVLYQRIAAAKERRPKMKVVLIDPRRTATADIADMHLAIKPDGDVPLFLGLLRFLARNRKLNKAYIRTHTSGFTEALGAADAIDLYALVRLTGISATDLKRFFELFAATERAVTVYSQGVNQSTTGTDKVNAIINCHLATGRIGRPGMGPFSVTGQPNAMGGREVGGLANMLAAHMAIESAPDRERVQRFWQSPRIAEKPGLKAVDMFRGVADGSIKALWIMATNPVVSMPEAENVAAAIGTCPFVVVSDVTAATDTARLAHVLLPAAAWGEKSGTVTNSERCISRQRSFLQTPGDARPDWWIISEVACRMGHGAAFSYNDPAEIFAEHAALSAFENAGQRDFDISSCAAINDEQYDDLAPFQWPRPADHRSVARMFSDGRFYTPDGKANFVAVQLASPPAIESAGFPLTLNTGRVRDHWHTMTRTGKSQRLSQHYGEPFVEIHPQDAARFHIGDAELVRVSTGLGAILVRALITPRQQLGSIFVPMHWNDMFASRARVDVLAHSLTDPISGQPALKNIPARIERFIASSYGFAVLRHRPASIDATYWAVAKCQGGWRVEIALAANPDDWTEFVLALVGGTADVIAYHDQQSGHTRFACYEAGTLTAVVFLAPQPVAVSRDWAISQLAQADPNLRRRSAVLAGRPGSNGADRGATVCACFAVGANEIAAAVANGCSTVAAVGAATHAGTNCGSCRAEIRNIIERAEPPIGRQTALVSSS
jgi:assimilatory nitrate reductase catalytic subunit